jgi:hypothetical protein
MTTLPLISHDEASAAISAMPKLSPAAALRLMEETLGRPMPLVANETSK